MDDDIASLHQDDEGGIWVGTYGGGLHRVDGKYLTVQAVPLDVGGSLVRTVNDVTSLDRGTVLLATDRGLVILDRARLLEGGESPLVHRPGVAATALSDVGVDGVWVGYADGVVQRLQIDGPSVSSWTVSDSRPLDFEVSAIVRGGDSKLFVGTRGGGLFLLDQVDDVVLDRFWTGSEIPLLNDRVQDLERGPHGRLWVATLEGLMAFPDLPSTGPATVLTRQSGLPHDRVLSLESSPEGLWVGTWEGIVLVPWRRDAIQAVTELSGIDRATWPAAGVVSIARAADDQLWVGTWGGGAVRIRLEPSAEGIQGVPFETALPGTSVFGLSPTDSDGVWAATLERGLVRVFVDGS